MPAQGAKQHAGQRQQRRIASLATFLGKRVRDITGSRALLQQGAEAACRVFAGGRRPAQGAVHRAQSLAKLAQRNTIVAPLVVERLCQGLGGEQSVLDAGAPIGIQCGSSCPLPTRLGERQQVSGEIAAVNGRDILGIQRAQIVRIIPVVEMPAKPFHPVERRKARLEAIERVQAADPTELARRHDRQEIQADIGRRGSMRDHFRGRFLIVVRRQHVLLGRHECREEQPCLMRHAAQGIAILCVQRCEGVGDVRQAHLACDQRCAEPDQHQQPQEPGNSMRDDNDQQRRKQGHQQTAPHARIVAAERGRELPLGLRSRGPFEQPTVRSSKPIERSPDGVGLQPGLIGKQRHP